MTNEKPYDPLDYENLTRNLVQELMARGPFDLPLEESFNGPGVYALFYRGDSPLYAPVRSDDASTPIYVGKAVPPGSRKGGTIKEEAFAKPALFKRLKEHWTSIDAVENIETADFVCRFLVVVPLWITMAERFLLERYQPLWNVCIEGFGVHNPGKGRHEGELPWWDTLHPGRSWSSKLRNTRTQEEAKAKLDAFYRASGLR